MNIGDLWLGVRADMVGFDKEIQTEAEKAGTKAGTTLGSRMGAAAKTAVKTGLVGLGAVAGAAFGVAARGGAELTDSVAAFRQETGASAEEAEIAGKSISSLYKTNTQGFQELGATLAPVTTNLGLSGAEAEDAAQRMLDYAKATGQDGVAATEAFDDLLDSLNLSYEQGSGLLDILKSSQEQYGGSVTDSQAALAKMAPALNAANLSVEDGVGLLNLFAASGIEAADAPQALTKALQKVESPEELRQLIEDISATEDPFQRAAKASDLFGARAGAKLANALDGVGFDEFAVSADEAAGSVERAAEAVDSTPFNRLKLALKQVSGPLAEVGQQFGPLILGFSQLGGPKVIGSITTGLGGLAGKLLPTIVAGFAGILPAITPILSGIGAAIPTIITAAMAAWPLLLVAAIVAGVIFLINNPEIVANIAEFVGGFIDTLMGFLGALPGMLVEFFSSMFAAVARTAPGMVLRIVEFIMSIPFRIIGLQVEVLKVFLGLIAKVLGAIPGFIGKVVEFFLSIPGKIANLVPQIFAHFFNLGTRIRENVSALIRQVVTWFMSLPGKIASLGGKIVSTIIRGLASFPGKLAGVIRRAFANLRIDIGPFHISGKGITIDLPNIQLPSFDVGAKNVPADMIAMVHKGEMIIPADEADVIRNGMAGTSSAFAEPASAPVAGTAIHLQTYGLPMRAQTPAEVVQRLRRAARLGTVTPRRPAPAWRPTGV